MATNFLGKEESFVAVCDEKGIVTVAKERGAAVEALMEHFDRENGASDMEVECERMKAECEAHEMARDAVQAKKRRPRRRERT